MGSILTNNGAMVALQTLSTINRNLNEVQSQISTGLKVGSAKDNAAVFAISQVMRSDVKGFEAISESLSLGQSTVAVGSNAADAVGELLNDIKKKIISAGEENVDRVKLQDELSSLRDQITGIVDAAQFNGLNVLSNQKSSGGGTTALTAAQVADLQGSGTVSVLSSLNRGSDQSISTSAITVAKQDLATSDAVFNVGAAADSQAAAVTGAGAIADAATGTLTIVGNAGITAATSERGGIAVLAGDGYRVAGAVFGATGNIDYVARDGDTVNDIAAGLAAKINFTLADQGISGFTVAANGAGVAITNNSGASITSAVTVGAGGTAGGGLELLGDIDISTADGAAAGLAAIESLIQTTVKGQAALGTSENRLEIQSDFMGTLIDSFKSGIGTLVDANLEEAAARLQSLQVQQQLGTQALSIANQAPQSILSLFR
ncbi:MAG: flagellin [Paracoccaceae bacterium]